MGWDRATPGCSATATCSPPASSACACPACDGVPIVSQGCRPIGYPYIVTGADGALITELGGRPPLQRLRETVEVLPPDEQELVSHGLQIGIVVDEHLAVPGQGDFMIRGLLGADPSTGAIKIGEVVEVGTTVQFQVRDAVGADKDLRLAVERGGSAAARASGRRAVVYLQRAWPADVRGRRSRRVDDRGTTRRHSARRFLRRRGDRPDRGPQRVARVHRVDGAVHRRRGMSVHLRVDAELNDVVKPDEQYTVLRRPSGRTSCNRRNAPSGLGAGQELRLAQFGREQRNRNSDNRFRPCAASLASRCGGSGDSSDETASF